ncbi:MAG: multidrug effflux MFS transporter [Gammaproteobacteria bacterium]|nr:multidrug effflux MFS transporter [Gammaproteobacteria bacterium]
MQTVSPLRYLPLFAAIFAITPLAVDMYLPAMPAMANFFDTKITVVQLSLSLFLAGYALGMLCFGPLADHYGRKRFLISGLVGFVITSFAQSQVTDIDLFNALRFVQALCGGAATVTVPGTIRDLFGKETAKGIAYVSMAMMIAPMLAPTLGSLILTVAEWQSIFVILSIYALFILLVTAKKFPFLPPKTRAHPKLFKSLATSYKIVFSQVKCYPFLLTTMLTTFTFFTYITSVSFVYISVYGISETVFGFLFGANVAALMLGNLINAKLVSRIGPLRMLRFCLIGAAVFAFLLCFILVTTSPIEWAVTALLFLMLHLMIISTNSDAMVLMTFPNQSGTATAIIGTLKFGSGACAGLLLSVFHDGTAAPFGYIVAGTVSLLVITQLVSWRFVQSIGDYATDSQNID